MPVRRRPLLARARDERGFGMIELLAAMTVMLIGILAVYGLFSAGLVQLRRASTKTTAAALADAQMEKFRAVRYDTLGIDASMTCPSGCTAADATYRGDSAYAADTSPATTLPAPGLTPTGTSVAFASLPAGFPALAEFYVKIESEVVLVTEVDAAAKTWTIVRPTDGSAASHASGAAVTLKKRVDIANCSGGGSPCSTTVPTTTATGADRRNYRVDTYITWTTASNSSGTPGRVLKLITIVVRDSAAPHRTWARVTSVFDQATGL